MLCNKLKPSKLKRIEPSNRMIGTERKRDGVDCNGMNQPKTKCKKKERSGIGGSGSEGNDRI
eukprot:scaffold618531_cov13-Prasinocladus_malaysianus.AAC.1